MRERGNTWVLYGVPLIFGVAAFWPLMFGHFGFVRWDDPDLVTSNPLLNPATGAHLREIWAHAHLHLYIPLTYTVYWGIARIAGVPNAGAFHLANVILHIASTLLVMGILSRRCGSRMAGLFGALLFELHPIQVESVAWIAEMNNVLSGALGLGAMLVFLIWAERGRAWVYGVGLFLFGLALLAKPSMVVVPVILTVLERRNWKGLIAWYWLAVIFALVAAMVQPGAREAAMAIYDRPFIAVDSLGFYLAKLLWPYPLSIDYARTPAYVMASGVWLLTGILLFAAIGIVLALRRRFPSPVKGLLIFAAGVLPVLGLAAFDFQRYSTVADRYVYLAMLGPALAVSGILAKSPRRMFWWIVAALLVIYVGLALPQEQTWRDTNALASHALAVDGGSEIGHKIRGVEFASQRQWVEAIGEYQAALKRNPKDGDVHFNYGNALLECGDKEDALNQYLLAAQYGFERGKTEADRLLGVPKP